MNTTGYSLMNEALGHELIKMLITTILQVLARVQNDLTMAIWKPITVLQCSNHRSFGGSDTS